MNDSLEKKERKIGFDLDDSVFDFIGSFIEYSNKTNKTSLKREDFVRYTFDVKKIFDFYNTDFFRKMSPLPNSKEVIISLKQNSLLYVVTSRPDFLYNDTMNHLWENFRHCFSDVFFSSNHHTGDENSGKTKAEICLKKGISVMIDDSLEYALQCAERGINALLLDAPWNRNGEHRGVIRVKNWKEIGELLI